MSSTSTRLRSPENSCSGHWLAEQAPEEMLAALAALTAFLAPYREDGGGSR